MRAITAALAIFAMLAASQAYAQWPHDASDSPRWEFEVTGKVLERPGVQQQDAVIFDALTLEPFLTAEQATDLDFGFGFDVRAIRRCSPFGEWEVVTGLNNWSETHLVAENRMASPFLPPDMTPEIITLRYESQLYNFELNSRTTPLPGLTLLAGPRFMNLKERMVIDTETFVIPPFPFEPIIFETKTTLTSRNPMLGLQVGAEYRVPIWRDIYVMGFIKAGGYQNWASRTFRLDNTFVQTLPERAERTTFSFRGEVGGKCYIDVVPRRLSLFAGYEANWMDQVALAPAQLANLEVIAVHTDSTPFFHGVTFGMRFTY